MRLRLRARVASCHDRVRLVGDGHGVEVTIDGATDVRVHNELVELTTDALVDGPDGSLWPRLERAQALDQRVSVDLVEVRGHDGRPLPDRHVAVTDDAGVTWHCCGPQR